MLKKFELGKEAIDYIKSCLEDLIDMNKILAQYLLKLPLEDGKAISYLPAESSKEVILDFNTGGIITDEITESHLIELGGQKTLIEALQNKNTREKLIEFILAFLQKNDNNYLIIEDTFASSSDFHILSNIHLFSCKNSIYHFLNSQYSNKKTINEVINDASRPYLYAGILTYSNKYLDIKNGKEISEEIIKMFAENTQHIFVSAYDGESEIIWSIKNNLKN
jgi:hypothetical protein